MAVAVTIRLPEDLAKWLDETARTSGVSRGQVVRSELERARSLRKQRFLQLAGAVNGPADLSDREGFVRK